MRFAKILALLFFVAIIYQLIGVYNTTAYETSFIYSGNVTPANNTNYIYVNEIENGNCNINLNSYAATIGTSYTISNSFYFPYNTLLGTSSVSKSGTTSCNFYGNFSNAINSNILLDTRLSYIDTATKRNTSLVTSLICTSDSITLKSNNSLLSNGYKLDNYNYIGGIINIIQTANNLTNCVPFSPYGLFTTKRFTHNDTVPIGKGMGYVYPFNTGNGQIYIKINETTVCPTNDEWFIFEKGQIIYNVIGLGLVNFAENLTLPENTDYYLGKYCSTGAGAVVVDPATVIIKIGTYEPVWDCSEYGECVNGTKQRLCIEHNGKLPNKLEFEVCYSAPDKILWLGMENTTTENVFYTEQGFACIPTIYVKNVDYPTDWYSNPVTNPKINNNYTGVIVNGFTYDNMMMSRETAKEGVYSLKLWNIPPERYIPYCPNNNTGSWLNISGFYGLCVNGSTTELYPDGNYTISLTPQVQKLINETYLVAHDLTFGYPNMSISLSVKKCDSVIKQYLNNSACQIIMGEGYYTIDKTSNHQIYNTKVFISIDDLNLSSSIYTVYFDANNEKLWNTYNIILTHLDTTHLYRFSIGIYDDIVSGKNYCAYIDDINLNAYSGSVGCESYCDDARIYHKFISQNANGCSFLETPMSPNCFDSSLIQYLTGCSTSFCPVCESGEPDYLTLYSGDNSTGECLWTTIENSDYCINYCSTQKLISDNPLAQDIAVYFQFFNPIWIITFIIMGIGAFLAYKIKDWHVFAISVIVGFLISAIVWIEMAFIAICIMIVVAYFMFKDMSSK